MLELKGVSARDRVEILIEKNETLKLMRRTHVKRTSKGNILNIKPFMGMEMINVSRCM